PNSSEAPPPKAPPFLPPNVELEPKDKAVTSLDRGGDDDFSEELGRDGGAVRILVELLPASVHRLDDLVVEDLRIGHEDHRLRLRILGLDRVERLGELGEVELVERRALRGVVRDVVGARDRVLV